MRVSVEVVVEPGKGAKYIAETDDPASYPMMEEMRQVLLSRLGGEIVLPATVVAANEGEGILHIALASQFLMDVDEEGLSRFLKACGLERVGGKLKGKIVGSDVRVVCLVENGKLRAKEVFGVKTK